MSIEQLFKSFGPLIPEELKKEIISLERNWIGLFVDQVVVRDGTEVGWRYELTLKAGSNPRELNYKIKF